jgi:Fur family transcriptional regulator, zinc uptake regulator
MNPIDDSPASARRVKRSAAVEVARRICGERGLRLTELRLATFGEVAENGPVSAYRLMALLRRRLDRRVDPPTVYRALDFLMDAGLVNRLETKGAYVIRDRPGQSQPSVLLLCERCESTVELEDPELLRLIEGDAAALGFRLGSPLIECSGTCERCTQNREATT